MCYDDKREKTVFRIMLQIGQAVWTLRDARSRMLERGNGAVSVNLHIHHRFDLLE
jgi:hypothetical protein